MSWSKYLVLLAFAWFATYSSYAAAEDSPAKTFAKSTITTQINKQITTLTEKASGTTRDALLKYFPTVETSLTVAPGSKPGFSALIVAPLSNPLDIKNTIFTQDSIFYRDGRTTVNVGLGYRRLEMDNTLLLGVNGFYDHEFPYGHGRTSLGLEATTSKWKVNANKYWANSGWVTGKSGYQERASNGYDLEAAVPVPYMNWMNVSVKKFRWDRDGVDLARGNEFSMNAALPNLPKLTIALGRTNFNGNDLQDNNFLRITYNFTGGTHRNPSSQSWFSESAYPLVSMESKRFEKVNRSNEIVKEIIATGEFIIAGI